MFKGPFIHILLIIVLGILAYSNTFNVPFHFDDANNIVENYKLKDLNNFWPPAGSRWFGFLTFALNYHFGGLNTIGYHIVNLTIHILNAILVYWLVVLTFRTPYFKVSVISASVSNQPTQFNLPTFKPLNYLPLFIALLFVSHPIQTQAVTYIVQRFTSLAAFFYLLSLVMYIKFRMQDSGYKIKIMHHASWIMYLCSLFSAILAMKTKEIAFTLPVVIALYEFMFFDGKIKKRVLYLIPLILTMLIIPLSMIGTVKPVGDAIGELREASQETSEIPRWSYLFTQFRVIVTYIRLLFFPTNQNLDYDYPVYHSFLNPNVFLSFLFLLLIFSFAIYLLSRLHHATHNLHNSNSEPQMLSISTRYTLRATRLIAFSIFWFFIALSVESSIIPIKDVIFEHRLYLPSVGVFIAITTSMFILANKFKSRCQKIDKAVISLLAVIVLVFIGITCARNIMWQDGVTLWEDVVRKSPKKARSYCNLAVAYNNKRLFDKVIENYTMAITINPNYAGAYNNRGNTYVNKGLYDKAIEDFTIAISITPNFAEAYNNRGIVYFNVAQYDRAIEDYTKAIAMNPNFAEAYNNRGNAHDEKGQSDKAIEDYNQAIAINPDYADAYFNRGLVYSRLDKSDNAMSDFQKACDMGNKNGCEALKKS